jgi:hypothetical protein
LSTLTPLQTSQSMYELQTLSRQGRPPREPHLLVEASPLARYPPPPLHQDTSFNFSPHTSLFASSSSSSSSSLLTSPSTSYFPSASQTPSSLYSASPSQFIPSSQNYFALSSSNVSSNFHSNEFPEELELPPGWERPSWYSAPHK